MVSPKVITNTPNRNLNTPKVTKITFGELEGTAGTGTCSKAIKGWGGLIHNKA